MKIKIPQIPVVSPLYRLLHDEGFIVAVLVAIGFSVTAAAPQLAAQIPWIEGLLIVLYLGLIGHFNFSHLIAVLSALPTDRKTALAQAFADALKDIEFTPSSDGTVSSAAIGFAAPTPTTEPEEPKGQHSQR